METAFLEIWPNSRLINKKAPAEAGAFPYKSSLAIYATGVASAIGSMQTKRPFCPRF